MEKIKGLILKDLYNLSSYRKSLFITIIVFATIFGFSGNAGAIGIMIFSYFGIMALSTFSYDEISKSYKYLLSLPINKNDLIKAKYLLVVLLDIIGAIVGYLIAAICIVAIEKYAPQNIIDKTPNMIQLGYTILGAVFGIGLVQNLHIPVNLKYGSEKGRFVFFILSAVIVGIIMGIAYLLDTFGNFLQELARYVANMTAIEYVIMTILFLGITFVISFLCSCKILKKKEF